ncbi:hypothetical protein [Methylobacterium brachiatum]|uniref:hypothetical protein n=1 Tax=Methylobacterium brachiatum TaxID=269660 RepID=UPI000F0CBEF6|nr:hypothetical protein [Methylobacterium brachiatum]AYO83663.1 hypothetical protein EBB05_16240 [Methylobacterium brachiatum]
MGYYDEQAPNVVSLRQAVTAIQAVAAAMQDSMGAQRIPGSGTFAFRRTTDPLQLPVGPGPLRFDVPEGFFAEGGPGFQTTTFLVVNPNLCYVRLRGSSTDNHVPVTPSTGWLFPPGFVGCFTTQYPRSMSTLAVAMPGFPLPDEFAPLELLYGGGT